MANCLRFVAILPSTPPLNPVHDPCRQAEHGNVADDTRRTQQPARQRTERVQRPEHGEGAPRRSPLPRPAKAQPSERQRQSVGRGDGELQPGLSLRWRRRSPDQPQNTDFGRQTHQGKRGRAEHPSSDIGGRRSGSQEGKLMIRRGITCVSAGTRPLRGDPTLP